MRKIYCNGGKRISFDEKKRKQNLVPERLCGLFFKYPPNDFSMVFIRMSFKMTRRHV